MEIGEPDFITPKRIIDAGVKALQSGHTHYTPALGLPELRQAISDYYQQRFGADVAPERIVITPGASGALQLVLGVLINPGDQVLMADPGYPCNRHFVRMFEGEAVSVNVDASTSYQLTVELIEQHWTDKTAAVMVASPSNPTGTIVPPDELLAINELVKKQNGHLIVDEIYNELIYEGEAKTILTQSDDVFVINSFSKFFGMTGWRIGWLVAPESYVSAMDRLAQNIFLATSTPAQHAALAAFHHNTFEILEKRKNEFQERRDYLLPALREIGFDIPVNPQGAFYLYADCSRFTSDSYTFTMELLEKAGVAITPGKDFGTNKENQHVRFAYTTSLENLWKGVERLKDVLK